MGQEAGTSSATHSTWWVIGNRSNARSRSSRSRARRRSRRRGPGRPGRRRRRRPRAARGRRPPRRRYGLAPSRGGSSTTRSTGATATPPSTAPTAPGEDRWRRARSPAACAHASRSPSTSVTPGRAADRVGEEPREQPDAGVEVEHATPPAAGPAAPARCRPGPRARPGAPARSRRPPTSNRDAAHRCASAGGAGDQAVVDRDDVVRAVLAHPPPAVGQVDVPLPGPPAQPVLRRRAPPRRSRRARARPAGTAARGRRPP